MKILKIALLITVVLAFLAFSLAQLNKVRLQNQELQELETQIKELERLQKESLASKKIVIHITGYNLLTSQTDDTPCIGASGKNLCGKDGDFTVACPRKYKLGTVFKIDNQYYTCEDRLAEKYDHRIDVNCKFDLQCPKQVTGTKEVLIVATN